MLAYKNLEIGRFQWLVLKLVTHDGGQIKEQFLFVQTPTSYLYYSTVLARDSFSVQLDGYPVFESPTVRAEFMRTFYQVFVFHTVHVYLDRQSKPWKVLGLSNAH